MSKRDKIINKIIRVVANAKYPDSEIYLYGSQARGEAKSLSDWDLLILLNLRNVSFDFDRDKVLPYIEPVKTFIEIIEE